MLPLNYFLFLQIILFLFITPGPPRIVIVSYSMNFGVQKCVWTALGDITANIIQATLVIFVIGSLFSENPNFLNIFKWLGVAYILYLAFDIYNSRPKEISPSKESSKSFFSGSFPMLTAVPKYLRVGVPEAWIAGKPVINPEPATAPTAATDDFIIFLLVIFLDIFFDINLSFNLNMASTKLLSL